ncbi:hypothetical protein [Flavobacterium columnare]|uniref:hypothetical protein n=1 Tax=Flavobacterium columnare TaxID=996 RepID=UPI003BA1C434
MFLKNKSILLYLILFSNFITAQGVIEYDEEYPVDFLIYDSSNNILKKPLSSSKSIVSSPEELVQSYFFATDSISLKSLFLDKTEYKPKKQKHFDATKKLNYDSNFITLLHKFSYEYDGNEMCYVNYIFKYENINFTMPTNLSCIKKNNQWYIYKLGNQININEILWIFKSCKIFQLIDGAKSNDMKTDNLISITRGKKNILDVNKLYFKSKKFDNNDSEFFTMAKDNTCSYNGGGLLKNKTIISSFLWKSINIEKLDKLENDGKKQLITSLKTNSIDSICLDSRLTINYNHKNYSILKYKDCTKNIFLTKTNTNELPNPITEFFYAFEKLKTKFISDLSNQILINDDKNFKSIFEKTRGQFNSLNTSKLSQLLKEDRTLFKGFLEE